MAGLRAVCGGRVGLVLVNNSGLHVYGMCMRVCVCADLVLAAALDGEGQRGGVAVDHLVKRKKNERKEAG